MSIQGYDSIMKILHERALEMINWLREVDSSIWGVLMSIIMAVLRIVRDKEEDKFFRIAVEA